MRDANGREYAQLSELKPGDKVEVDGGFTCLRRGEVCEVHANPDGKLFIFCSGHGDFSRNRCRIKDRSQTHGLNGQADDGENCVGVYRLPPQLPEGAV